MKYFSRIEKGLWLSSVSVILLWVLAGIENISYLSVVGCFLAFLANDLYAFIAWRRMEKKQSLEA